MSIRKHASPERFVAFLTFLSLLTAYCLTLAPTIVYGDPTEYTFVANILGIAHPPGYAFFTLLGKLFQSIIPVGDIPRRMHLLSATAAATTALFAYGTVLDTSQILFSGIADLAKREERRWWGLVAATFAALTIGFGVNFWQHAIHANPHIVSAAFLAANLFFLTRWYRRGTGQTRWLFAFAFSAGLGITHHPLTVIAFPAYAVFILLARPRLLREWRTVLSMGGCALLGLAVWLYFPLRSPMEPAFGPSTMNTLDGFLDHVLARGLSDSLPFFGPADLPSRLIVFWTILRAQYSLPVVFMALVGLACLAAERRFGRIPDPAAVPANKLAVLFGLVFLSNYAFVMSLRAQDIMAYVLGLLVTVGILAGIGLFALLALAAVRLRLSARTLGLLAAALLLLGPGLQVARNATRVSLSGYTEAADYVSAVFERFEGTGEEATLLNDWEHMTPIWYARFVEGRSPAEQDVRPLLVSTAQPWLESVFSTLPGGPVYISNYRREIVDAGFRLRPDDRFYQVVEPGDSSLPEHLTLLPETKGGPVEILGYDLPIREVAAGDLVPLTLALSSSEGTSEYFVPVVRVGQLSFPFTTDSHITSPTWLPGEVIIERFDFALPFDLPSGVYPVTVSLRNLTTDQETSPVIALGEMRVAGLDMPPDNSHLLANFRQRVGLLAASAWNGGQRRTAVWDEPLHARPGDTIWLLLKWRALARAEESYTVFVHLIDAENRPLATLDYTPLGGSTPTHLWIPKWLPGQQYFDPYRMKLRDDLPPGTYYIEVGLYEMVSKRRLHMADEAGNLIGDRLILGPIEVSAD